MQRQWLYTGVILSLFLMLVLGIPFFPNLMAIEILGPLNLGMSVFLILHIVTPLLAFRYLRIIKEEEV